MVVLDEFFQRKVYDAQGNGKLETIVWSTAIRNGYLVHLIAKLAFELMFFYTVYWYQTKQTKVRLLRFIFDDQNAQT